MFGGGKKRREIGGDEREGGGGDKRGEGGDRGDKEGEGDRGIKEKGRMVGSSKGTEMF